jgi:hypothetical protein
MDVDDLVIENLAELVAEDLHITGKHDEFDLPLFDEFKDLCLCDLLSHCINW